MILLGPDQRSATAATNKPAHTAAPSPLESGTAALDVCWASPELEVGPFDVREALEVAFVGRCTEPVAMGVSPGGMKGKADSLVCSEMEDAMLPVEMGVSPAGMDMMPPSDEPSIARQPRCGHCCGSEVRRTGKTGFLDAITGHGSAGRHRRLDGEGFFARRRGTDGDGGDDTGYRILCRDGAGGQEKQGGEGGEHGGRCEGRNHVQQTRWLAKAEKERAVLGAVLGIAVTYNHCARRRLKLVTKAYTCCLTYFILDAT